MLVAEIINIEREVASPLIEMVVEIAKQPLLQWRLQLFEIEAGIQVLCELLAYRSRYSIGPEHIREFSAPCRLIKQLVLLDYGEAHVDELFAFLIAIGVGRLHMHGGKLAKARLDPLVVEGV